MAAPNQMNCRKGPKEGGGGAAAVIFNPKIYVADFGKVKQAF